MGLGMLQICPSCAAKSEIAKRTGNEKDWNGPEALFPLGNGRWELHVLYAKDDQFTLCAKERPRSALIRGPKTEGAQKTGTRSEGS